MATGVLQNLYNHWRSHRERKEDIGMQKEQQTYDRSMQNLIFEREDNSVERRVEDLKKSGINPILAAGQGAGAGIAYHSHSPKAERTSALDLQGSVLTMLEQAQRIKNMEAQEKQINTQTGIMESEELREAGLHSYRLTQMDYDLLEQKFNIDNQDIRRRAMILENDRRLQQLDIGEREKLAAVIEIAYKDVTLSRARREEYLDSLFNRTQNSPSGVLQIAGDWLNAGASSLADLMNRIDNYFGNDFRIQGRGGSPTFNDRYRGE